MTTLSIAAALLVATACGAQVTVSDAWVRATAPGQKIAGAYFKITSATKAYLVGASSQAAQAVEVHEMSITNNVMKMRPVARLELPAGRAVELKPGGYHLMLIDVAHPLANGDSVPIKLSVEGDDGKRHNLEVTAHVRDFAAMGVKHGPM
jgi:hypothetical protein